MKNNPIIVALDTDDVKWAQKLSHQLADHVGGFKIGPRFTLRADKSFIKDLSQLGILFFDHKFFDIPSTTLASVNVAFELGAQWVSVHALNGRDCLAELSLLESQIKKNNDGFRILAVTVLTSFNRNDLPPVWKDESIEESVQSLTSLAFSSGIKTIVCSPEEIKTIKSKYPESFLVVPGIRTVESNNADQKRVATPLKALQDGASALVIGRPIFENSNPAEAAKKIYDSLKDFTGKDFTG